MKLEEIQRDGEKWIAVHKGDSYYFLAPNEDIAWKDDNTYDFIVVERIFIHPDTEGIYLIEVEGETDLFNCAIVEPYDLDDVEEINQILVNGSKETTKVTAQKILRCFFKWAFS